MISISAKSKYGVAALLDIAINDNKLTTLKSIAKRTGISEKFLEKIFLRLRESQIVASVKGSKGGYYINEDIKNITLKSILFVLEDSLIPVDCIEKETCNRQEDCITRNYWRLLSSEINKVFDVISLYELVKEYKKYLENQPLMYYI